MNLPPQDCNLEEGWTPSVPVGISLWKRYADVTYQLPSLNVTQVANVSGKVELEYTPAETYLSLFDILFPKEGEPIQLYDSLKAALLIFAIGAVRTNSVFSITRLYVLPWLLQSPVLSEDDLLSDNYLDASVCKSVYRIQLEAKSFYTFTVFSILILAWCLIRLMQSLYWPSPPLSSLSELNLVDKLVPVGEPASESVHANGTASEIFSLLRTFDKAEVIKKFDGVQVYLDVKATDLSLQPEAHEMRVLRHRRWPWTRRARQG